MSTICVVVADNFRARIFETTSRTGSLNERQTLLYPEARLRVQDVNSDIPSAAFNSSADKNGQSRHHTSGKTDMRQQQSLRFASDIVKQLKRSQENCAFSSLILVAPSKFLGILRQQLDNNLEQSISYELHKELTQLDVDKIRAHLPIVLPIKNFANAVFA